MNSFTESFFSGFLTVSFFGSTLIVSFFSGFLTVSFFGSTLVGFFIFFTLRFV